MKRVVVVVLAMVLGGCSIARERKAYEMALEQSAMANQICTACLDGCKAEVERLNAYMMKNCGGEK